MLNSATHLHVGFVCCLWHYIIAPFPWRPELPQARRIFDMLIFVRVNILNFSTLSSSALPVSGRHLQTGSSASWYGDRAERRSRGGVHWSLASNCLHCNVSSVCPQLCDPGSISDELICKMLASVF